MFKIKFTLLALTVGLFLGCAATPPSQAVYVNKYEHRIVKVVPVTHHKVVTVKVHHTGPLTRAEKNHLKSWYRHKYKKPHHRVDVVLIRR